MTAGPCTLFCLRRRRGVGKLAAVYGFVLGVGFLYFLLPLFLFLFLLGLDSDDVDDVCI